MADYTIEELREARKGALAAGDTAAAEKLLRAAQRVAVQNAPRETYDPTEGMSGLGKFRAGIGQGMVNVGRHVGNLAGLVEDEDLQAAKQTDAALLNTTAGRAGSILGETAATALPIAGGTAALARAGKFGAQLVGGTIRRGALEGAAQGALMADPGSRLQGAALGGTLGTALPGAAAATGKLVRGMSRTPEAQKLLDAGVDLTPGQLKPAGVFNQLEEAWQSVPVVGSAISGARENARNTLQRAAIQEAAAPGAKIAQGEADEMLDAAYKSFAPLYDKARGVTASAVIRNKSGGVPLSVTFANAAQNQTVRAADDVRKSVGSWLSNKLSAGVKSTDDLIDLRSSIRSEIRKARNQNEASAADLLEGAESSVTRALESHLSKDALSALRTADSKYGTYKVLEDAVARAKDKPGGFTPSDLSAAVASQSGRGTGKGSYARGGGGAVRELAAAGKESLAVRSPATGARLAAIGVPVSIGALEPTVGIPLATTLLALTASKTGRRAAAGLTAPQRAAQRLVGQGLGRLGPTGQILLPQYLNRAGVAGGLGYAAQE